MHIIRKINYLLISLLLPPIILVYTTSFYISAFERYQVYKNFAPQYSISYLQNRFVTVLEYLQPFDQSQLDPTFFSHEDILHMQDVRNIYQTLCVILAINIFLFIILKIYKQKAPPTRYSKRIYFVILGLLIAMVSFILLDFNDFFLLFHKLLFPNNTYWSLDPATSNLIKFLPSQIFYELAIIWLIMATVIYLIPHLITAVHKRKAAGKSE